MRVLIVGLGNIGKRHLFNIRKLLPSAYITVWHQNTNPENATDLPSLVDCFVYNLEDALNSDSDLALITNPSSKRIETILALVNQGIPLFVEKPFSDSLTGIRKILREVREKELVLMIGYNFRFYEPFQIIHEALSEKKIGRILSIQAHAGQYLPDWRPGKDYRQSVSAKKELGGGVVLELSHELDYIRWFVGEVKMVVAINGHLSDLEINVEDTSEIVLQFENGALGHIHLDMIDRAATRSCRIVGTEGTITWDGLTHQVRMYSTAENSWSDLHPAKEIDRNEMYLAELQYFLECIRKNTSPMVSGEDGKRVLEILLAAKQSSQDHRFVKL